MIKKYKDAATFYASEKEFLSHSSSLSHLLARIEDRKKGRPNDPENVLAEMVAEGKALPSVQFNYLAGPISELYYFENRQRGFAQIATFLAYFVGGMLLAIPTVVTAIQIFAAVIGKL